MPLILTALPNVSTPCVTTNPCTCPVYGPGGVYLPVVGADGPYCALALDVGPPAATPVPTLSEWGLLALGILLAIVGARRAR